MESHKSPPSNTGRDVAPPPFNGISRLTSKGTTHIPWQHKWKRPLIIPKTNVNNNAINFKKKSITDIDKNCNDVTTNNNIPPALSINFLSSCQLIHHSSAILTEYELSVFRQQREVGKQCNENETEHKINNDDNNNKDHDSIEENRATDLMTSFYETRWEQLESSDDDDSHDSDGDHSNDYGDYDRKKLDISHKKLTTFPETTYPDQHNSKESHSSHETSEQEQLNEHNDEYYIHVMLFSSPCDNSKIGDTILIQILPFKDTIPEVHPQNETHPTQESIDNSIIQYSKSIFTKILYWPSSVYNTNHITKLKDDSSTPTFLKPLIDLQNRIQSFIFQTKNQSLQNIHKQELQMRRRCDGLTHVTLARRSIPTIAKHKNRSFFDFFRNQNISQNNIEISIDDAMDILQHMSLGLDSTIKSETDGSEKINTNKVSNKTFNRKLAQSLNSSSNDKGQKTTISNTRNNMNEHNQSSIDRSSNKQSHKTKTQNTELVLLCLDNLGQVHWFSILELLSLTQSLDKHHNIMTSHDYKHGKWNETNQTTVEENDFLGDGFASILFGETLHQKVVHSIKPLSRPIASLQLSLLRPSYIHQSIDHVAPDDEGDDDADNKAIYEEMNTQTHKIPKELHETNMKEAYESMINEHTDDQRHGEEALSHIPFDFSLLNGNIDFATSHYRTKNNVPTIFISAFDHIVIGGDGLRHLRRRIRRSRPITMVSSYTSIQKPSTVVRQNEKTLNLNENSSRLESRNETNAIKKIDSYEIESSLIEAYANNEVHQTPVQSPLHVRPFIFESHETVVKQPDEDYDYIWEDYTLPGGFVSVVSLHHYSEARNIFIPFNPKYISPIEWNMMKLLLVIGSKPNECMAIRVDASSFVNIPKGSLAVEAYNKREDSQKDFPSQQQNHANQVFYVRKFTPMPISFGKLDEDFPDVEITPVSLSSSQIAPANIILSFRTKENFHFKLFQLAGFQQIASNDTLNFHYTSNISNMIQVITIHSQYHFVDIPDILQPPEPSKPKYRDKIWSLGGQGYNFLGFESETQCHLFWILWEGATKYGAFWNHLFAQERENTWDGLPGKVSILLPSHNHQTIIHHKNSPYSESVRSHSIDVDDVILGTIHDLENFNHDYADDDLSTLPHLLLRRCSSWTQLDDTKRNRDHNSSQVAIADICFDQLIQNSFSVTIRGIVNLYGEFCPFHEVLSWLCQLHDYYSAACVSLHLLQDLEALSDLMETPYPEDESYLHGLLDGIMPIDIKTNSLPTNNHPRNPSVLMVSLADMAVGCLLKGGISMSHTLYGFLSRNKFYDASKACLMLIASAWTEIKLVSGSDIDYHNEFSCDPLSSGVHVLWPIQCLLQVAVTRDCLTTALLLLNAVIPDELRNRSNHSSSTFSEFIDESPPMHSALCKSIISMIVASSDASPSILLSLRDVKSNLKYWSSIDHDTRLAISTLLVKGKCPFLREANVRNWALMQLDSNILTALQSSDRLLPIVWLQQICIGTFLNAGCDFSSEMSGVESIKDEISYNIEAIAQEMIFTRYGMGGIDFDLLIPSLLLLDYYELPWNDKSVITTKQLLNVVCHLAGRRTTEEPLYTVNIATVMKQCAMMKNIMAAANVIGGHDGLHLRCVHILVTYHGFTIEDAEEVLMLDSVIKEKDEYATTPPSTSEFIPSDGHFEILHLLNKHVLSVKKYGAFNRDYSRGNIDPVFATRLCLRTWLHSCTKSQQESSTRWLKSWLEDNLGKDPKSGLSSKRLACAALLRGLLWDESSSHDAFTLENQDFHPIAMALAFDSKFLVFLSRASCGLVESIPPIMMNSLISKMISD